MGVPPPGQLVPGIGHPPRFAPSPLGNGSEPGIVTPGEIGLDVLYPVRQESPSLAAGQRRYALPAVRVRESTPESSYGRFPVTYSLEKSYLMARSSHCPFRVQFVRSISREGLSPLCLPQERGHLKFGRALSYARRLARTLGGFCRRSWQTPTKDVNLLIRSDLRHTILLASPVPCAIPVAVGHSGHARHCSSGNRSVTRQLEHGIGHPPLEVRVVHELLEQFRVE